jgi:hypothetical protein
MDGKLAGVAAGGGAGSAAITGGSIAVVSWSMASADSNWAFCRSCAFIASSSADVAAATGAGWFTGFSASGFRAEHPPHPSASVTARAAREYRESLVMGKQC